MEYELKNTTIKDLEYIKKAKLYNILNFAHNLSKSELDEINKYVDTDVSCQYDKYSIINYKNIRIGCIFITKENDGILIDEIYLDEGYRGKGIGSSIIKKIINDNDTIYLWVYKENIKAINLYKKLGFIIIDETENRYYMKKSK